MPELKGSEFMATLVLVLKEIESEGQTKDDTFFNPGKKKQLSMKVTLMIMYLNQSILQLHQNTKIFRKRLRLIY